MPLNSLECTLREGHKENIRNIGFVLSTLIFYKCFMPILEQFFLRTSSVGFQKVASKTECPKKDISYT